MRRLNAKGIIALAVLGFVLGFITSGQLYDLKTERREKFLKDAAVKIALERIEFERARDLQNLPTLLIDTNEHPTAVWCLYNNIVVECSNCPVRIQYRSLYGPSDVWPEHPR